MTSIDLSLPVHAFWGRGAVVGQYRVTMFRDDGYTYAQRVSVRIRVPFLWVFSRWSTMAIRSFATLAESHAHANVVYSRIVETGSP